MADVTFWGSLGKEKFKKKSNLAYYLFAFFIGASILVVIFITLKATAFLFRFLFNYWMWLVGSVVAVLIIRKLLIRKQLKVVN